MKIFHLESSGLFCVSFPSFKTFQIWKCQGFLIPIKEGPCHFTLNYPFVWFYFLEPLSFSANSSTLGIFNSLNVIHANLMVCLRRQKCLIISQFKSKCKNLHEIAPGFEFVKNILSFVIFCDYFYFRIFSAHLLGTLLEWLMFKLGLDLKPSCFPKNYNLLFYNQVNISSNLFWKYMIIPNFQFFCEFYFFVSNKY